MKRITPKIIRALKRNERFVFGSNLLGIHGTGSASSAHILFGAKWGVGEGPTGLCYAIPTKVSPYQRRDLGAIYTSINKFIKYAQDNPDLIFYVTPIGCLNAGFRPEQIAPLFEDALKLNNVYLPLTFVSILDINS